MVTNIVCSLLVMSLLNSVSCQRGVMSNETTYCTIEAQLQNFAWKHASSASKLQGLQIYRFSSCCEGFVYKSTPTCNPGCPSGSCIHGYCPPDDDAINCICYDDKFYPHANADCIPVCEPSQDYECTCHAGYTKDSRTNLCVPTECYNRCTNGLCDQIGTCVVCNHTNMDDMYRNAICLLNDCVQNCFNGQCNESGACECHKGFKNVNNLTCTQIMCPSYDNEDGLFCKEQCDFSCTDGKCTDDGRCICNSGYKTSPENPFKCQKVSCPSSDFQDNTFCKSKCYLKCTNGECSDAGSCKCNYGFMKDLTNSYNCLAIVCPSSNELGKAFCKETCINKCKFGICNTQSKCTCNSGYSKPSLSPYTCVPECNVSCGSNAICTGPNLCTCASGYIEIASSGSCVKKCINRRDCTNGTCSFNDGKCSCDGGYHLDVTNKCVPLCILGCTNGNCTGLNECSCDEGFVEVDGFCVDDCSAFGVCKLAWIGVGAAVGTLVLVATVVGGLVAWWIAKGRKKKSMSLDDCVQDHSFGIELQQ